MSIKFDEQQYADYGATVLRISLGVVLIAHSLYLKLMVFTLAGTANFFASIGLPDWFAYIVFLTEAITGVALVLGYKSRICALIVIPILLGAAWAHWPNGWLFTAQNGGCEYPLYLAFTAVGVAFLGDGAFAIKRITRPSLTQVANQT